MGINNRCALAFALALTLCSSVEAQVRGDSKIRCVNFSPDAGVTTTCLCAVGDQLWEDTNCNNTKDGAEAFIVDTTAYQPLDGDLTAIAALASTTGNVMIGVAGAWSSVAQPIINCTNCTNTNLSSVTGTLDQSSMDGNVVMDNESNTYTVGTQNFSSVKLDIESGDTAVVEAEGEIAIDNGNEGQFLFHDDLKERRLNAEREICKTIESLAAADDGVPLFKFRHAATLVTAYCLKTGAATPTVTLLGTTAGTLNAPTCSATPTEDTTWTSAAITAGDRITLDTGTAASAGSWVMVCVTYTDSAQ